MDYSFTNEIWQYHGKGAWVFVSLPKAMAAEIRLANQGFEEGWGRLRVTAKIGELKWKTAIWYDTKLDTYLLPLKTEIRKKGNLAVEYCVTVHLSLWSFVP